MQEKRIDDLQKLHKYYEEITQKRTKKARRICDALVFVKVRNQYIPSIPP